MPFDGGSAWRQRLQFNDSLLAQVEEHARDLEVKRHAAEAAFEAARLHLEVVKGEITEVRAHSEALKASSDQLRRSLASRVLQRFPDELLRAIFIGVLSQTWKDHDLALVPGIREHCAPRVKAPFVLAAVCSRWRDLALRVPHLWTYISVPAQAGIIVDSYGDLVQLLLDRSRPVSLDIFLPWDQNLTASWEPADPTPEARILELLAEESHRWRNFELQVASGAFTLLSMSLLRTLTPELEVFTILGHEEDRIIPWSPDFPRFLPLCPKLRRFWSRRTNILPSASGGLFQSLSALNLTVDMPCAAVWDILRCAAPRLQILCLAFERPQPDDSDIIASNIAFPVLRQLTADIHTSTMLSSNAALVSLDSLRMLTVSPSCIAILHPLWQHGSVKLRKLVLETGSLFVAEATALLPLTQVKDLILTCCVLTREFLDALGEEQDDSLWLLPNLEVLTIGVDSEVSDEDGERLIRVVQARNLAHERGAEHAPRELRDVLFDEANVPEWTISQVRYAVRGEIPS